VNGDPFLTPRPPSADVAPRGVPLRVLLVEDRPSDVDLLVHLLQQAGFTLEWECVETESEYLIQLRPGLDIILSDYSLPRFSGLDALRLLRERRLDIPFILITGTAGEETAVAALQLGADDYLLKDRLARLGRSVTRALEQRALREEKLRTQQELRDSDLRLLNLERAARSEAEAGVRMRDEFMAIASHELRTPVTTIKCTAQLLLSHLDRGDCEPAKLHGRLKAVEKMSDRLARLIGDLLDVTRLRTGQLELRTDSLDLARLVAEVVNQEHLEANSRSVPVLSVPVLSVLGELPPIVADPDRIEQVLSNVLNNAFKYSPQDCHIEVVVRAKDDGVLLSVADQGIGLPRAALEAIFEPFGRAVNAQRRQLPGMGLGLYISRQIVEQHGGRIWADSLGEENGTLISIWLPCSPGQRKGSEASRVLTVENELAIRDSLRDALTIESYDCRLAANGQDRSMCPPGGLQALLSST
jgi:signal transduction histidine kinase